MRRWIVISLVFLKVCIANADLPSLCLTMLVQNNEETIERCLSSVRHLIDYWVIIDTGSTDRTPQIVKEALEGIPGEFHERDWVDFAFNRTQLMHLAKKKADYLFVFHPNEFLETSEDFFSSVLDKDLYYLRSSDGNKRIAIVKSDLQIQWEGNFLPVLQCLDAETMDTLEGVISVNEGASILDKQFWEHPTNPAYAFYTGVSHLIANHHEQAALYFHKRLQIPSSNQEESFHSLYYLGLTQELLGNRDAAIKHYLDAYGFRPSRAEPLIHLAKLYRESGNLFFGYLISKFALSLPYPSTDFYVDPMDYKYTLPIEYANCVLLSQRWEEGIEACNKLLAIPELTPAVRSQISINQEIARRNLEQQYFMSDQR